MTKFNFILFLIAVALSSCVKDLGVGVSSEPVKLVVNSEVDANGNVYVIVSTSVPVGSDLATQRPGQGELDAFVEVEGGETEFLTFGPYYSDLDVQGSNEQVWRGRRLFLPEPGTAMTLNVAMVDHPEVEPIVASTIIPEPVDMSNITFLGEEPSENNLFRYRVQLDLEANSSEYYHLFAENEDNQLNIRSFEAGANAVIIPRHHFGVLIDGSRLNDTNTLNFVIESKVELTGSDLVLRTTNPSYFSYHESLSRGFSSESSPFNEPTVQYSNIDNGQGIFTSYSTVTSSVQF